MLIRGCIVSVKAALSHKLVMKKHDVPMSPMHTAKEFATVIRRAKFEDSNYEKMRISTKVECGFNESLIHTEVNKFVTAFVNSMRKGDAAEFNSNQTAISSYMAQSAYHIINWLAFFNSCVFLVSCSHVL
jgi:hypothetical protein